MKYVRILFAVALVFMVCSAFSFKKGKEGKEKAVYAFGVAASFNDTVVYFTDIQVLDSVKLDKGGFLPKRDLYTYQLKNLSAGTCIYDSFACIIGWLWCGYEYICLGGIDAGITDVRHGNGILPFCQ